MPISTSCATTVLDLLLGRAFFHDHHHGYCPPSTRPAAGRLRLACVPRLAVDPLEAPRFVDDAFEQPRDGIAVERPAALTRAHVLAAPSRLAVRLVDLQAAASSSARRSRARTRARSLSSATSSLVERDRCVAQLVDRRRAVSDACPFSHRTYAAFDPLTRAEVRLTGRGPATCDAPARCRRPPHRRTRRPRATCSGREMPKPSAIGSDVLRPDARDQRLGARRRRPPRAGDAEPRDPVEEPAPAARPRCRIRSLGRRRAQQEDHVEAASRERGRASPASSIGRSSTSTPSTPASAARSRERARRPSAGPDWRR